MPLQVTSRLKTICSLDMTYAHEWRYVNMVKHPFPRLDFLEPSNSERSYPPAQDDFDYLIFFSFHTSPSSIPRLLFRCDLAECSC